MFKQDVDLIQQLKQQNNCRDEMTVIEDVYLDNLQLVAGKRPEGEDKMTKAINLLKILIERMIKPMCLHSQIISAVKNVTIKIGGASKHLTAREWQQKIENGIITGFQNATKTFFSQVLTKEQVINGIQPDMSYHHTFLNGLFGENTPLVHVSQYYPNNTRKETVH